MPMPLDVMTNERQVPTVRRRESSHRVLNPRRGCVESLRKDTEIQ